MMTKATNAKPAMWGPAIVGFGDHDYTGASGKATKWFQAGFSPRKQALTLYLMGGKDGSCSRSCRQRTQRAPAASTSSASKTCIGRRCRS